MLKVDMKELESPCVVVASRNRRPSTSTAAASVRSPRIRMLVFCPGPPPLVTTTPGTVRKVSLNAYSLRFRISSWETVLTAFEISSSFCGAPAAVTTTESLTPATCSTISAATSPPFNSMFRVAL